MASTAKEKELKRKWPITSGLIAETTKQEGRISNLIPQESSKIQRKFKSGINA